MFDWSVVDVEAYLEPLARAPEPGWEGPLRITGTTDEDSAIQPLRDLVDGDAQVVPDATAAEARDAWEHAAAWTQSHLDVSERLFRVADARRTRRLLTAYRAAVQHLTDRYGTQQGHCGS